MFVVKLLPFVRNLSGRKWSDDEIVEDVQYLKDELSAHFENLTCVFLLLVVWERMSLTPKSQHI